MRTTNIDMTVRFAADMGHGLDEATRLVRNCDVKYVEWLERHLEQFSNHNHYLLNERQPHLY